MHPGWHGGVWLGLWLTAAPVLAQDYREEKMDEVGIKFSVYKKLSGVPMQLAKDSGSEHMKAKFLPKDPGDYLHGAKGSFEWYLEIHEFPKSGKEPKASADGHESREARRHASSFKEFVTVPEKDPLSQNRKFVVQEKEFPAKPGRPAYKYWEYFDTQKRGNGDLVWYAFAAAYDLPDAEVAILGRVPVMKGERPAETHTLWCTTMVKSGALLKDSETAKTAAETAAEAKRDKKADTPRRKASLERAKQNIAGVDGWDYFTSDNYVVLFSWDHEKAEKRQASETFARDLVGRMEKMRRLYQEYYPPHEKMAQNYSVVRICYDYPVFTKYSGASGGVVGLFNPSNKELVFFQGDKLMGSGATDTVAFHEGWHQYSDSYFRPVRGHKQEPADGEKPQQPQGGTKAASPGDEDAADATPDEARGVELHRWFDEGTGDYFGSFVWVNGKWQYFASKMRKGSIKGIVSQKQQVPMREIVSWNKDKFYGGRAADYYAQAYSMIDFFRRGKKELGAAWDPAWDGILDTYAKVMLETGNQKQAVEAAFKEVDWDKIEAAWVRWVKEFLK